MIDPQHLGKGSTSNKKSPALMTKTGDFNTDHSVKYFDL